MDETEIVEIEEVIEPIVEGEVEEEVDWKARAEKAEALIVKHKKAPEKPVEATPSVDPIEAALRVSGMSKELIEQLKKVASVTGLDLIDAQADPIFVAVKDKFEKDQKRESASLPASRGASTVKAKKDFNTPGLTREEHRALVQAQS